jgi:starch-binding outer membrane protein, SusD/RagB family
MPFNLHLRQTLPIHRLILPILLSTMLLQISCKKYVDIQPQGKIVPTTLNDYQQLLNNSTVFNLGSGTTELMTDNTAFTDTSIFTSEDPATLNIYSWAQQIYQASQDDPEWNLYYTQIYYANVVITGVPAATNATDTGKAQVIAAAKVHRAYAYLCLVNQYAAQYDSSTASSAAGVPLLLIPNFTQPLNRASVKAIYDQVLDDLHSAVQSLPGLPVAKTDPSQAAAYAILARTYLDMSNYREALAYADSALQLQSIPLDLRPLASSTSPFDYLNLPPSNLNPEVILMKASNAQDAPILLSQDLLDLLGPNDLRGKVFAIGGQLLTNYNGYLFSYISPLEAPHVGPRVGEMYTIKAECQARLGDVQGAMQTVNALRVYRIDPASYQLLTASNQQDALTIALRERRRELFGRGFRLFDLKRLNRNPATAITITHPWRNNSNITLAPNSNGYIYPVAQKILAINPEIGQRPGN